MKKILLFNTSYGTQNMGDFIINEAISEEMSYLLDGFFVVHYGTHNPILRFSQNIKSNPISKYCEEADYKFLCGTNLFSKTLDCLVPNFNVNFYDSKNYKNSIAIGCGLSDKNKKTSPRTRIIYKRILSKKFQHSTRDESTKLFLESLGVRAINTGCPTLWKLTKEFCRSIPRAKASRVVFTLTDYDKNMKRDKELIRALRKNYKSVYFWVQGSGDYDYYMSLKEDDGIVVIPPSLKKYKAELEKGDIDYVGTRLHAGIYAMRHGIRSIIIAIDNRVRDMKQTYNLVTIEREDMGSLEGMINSEFSTDIHINEEAIDEWKKQFNNDELVK